MRSIGGNFGVGAAAALALSLPLAVLSLPLAGLLALPLVLSSPPPVSASIQAPARAESVVVAADGCYTQEPPVFGSVELDWGAKPFIQTFTRSLSGHVDNTPGLFGYAIEDDARTIHVVFRRGSDPEEYARSLRELASDAGAVVGAAVPLTVSLVPTCRDVDLDIVHRSVGNYEWADDKIPNGTPVTVEIDLVAGQIVAIFPDESPTNRHAMTLIDAAYGDDVRIEVDPDHPRFGGGLQVMVTPTDPEPEASSDSDISSAEPTGETEAASADAETETEGSAGVPLPFITEAKRSGDSLLVIGAVAGIAAVALCGMAVLVVRRLRGTPAAHNVSEVS